MVTSSISCFIQFHDIVIAMTKNERNNVIYEHIPYDPLSAQHNVEDIQTYVKHRA